MVHGTVRSFFQLLGALVLTALILLAGLVWRLSLGPIALNSLTPYVEAALSAEDGTYRTKIDGTQLALGDAGRLLDIRAVGVRVYAGGDQPVATLPRVALTLNGRDLLLGVVEPKFLELQGLKVRLVRAADGRFELGGARDQTFDRKAAAILFAAIAGPPVPSTSVRRLQRLSIVKADIAIDDKKAGTVWRIPDADIRLERVAGGLDATIRAAVELDGHAGSVAVKARYRRDGQILDGTANLTHIRLATLGRWDQSVAALSALDVPVSGTIRAEGSVAGGLSAVHVDLAGDAGWLRLPEPLAVTRHIAGIMMRGSINHGMKRARIDDLTVDFGGPILRLDAVIDGLGGPTTVNADTDVTNMPVATLMGLWPQSLAPDPRAWVADNMRDGTLQEAKVTVAASSATGHIADIHLDKVEGHMKADGMTVDYLRPMPPATKVAATATFDAHAMRILFSAGQCCGLKVTGGTVVLSGLDGPDQDAAIDLDIAGPVSDALALIDHPPLHYASALALKGKAGGMVDTRLHLTFPLIKSLKAVDMGVGAHVVLADASLTRAALGLDMTHGALVADINGKAMTVAGTMNLGTIPTRLTWTDQFSAGDQPSRNRYVIEMKQVDGAQRRMLGLDGPPFDAPWLVGLIGVKAVIQTQRGRGTADLVLDLSPARMDLPGLGWHKETRTTGTARIAVALKNDHVVAIPRFDVTAGDLTASGSVAFDGADKVRTVRLRKLAYGRSDLNATIGVAPSGQLDISASGKSFDAQPMLAASSSSSSSKDDATARSLRVTAAFGKVWLSGKGHVDDVTLDARREGDKWVSGRFDGKLVSGKSLSAVLQRDADGHRALHMESDDAGGVLRAFDLYDDMIGGRLAVDGILNDATGQGMKGEVHIHDYSVVHTPVLARLLSVAALTGIGNLLQGKGIAFSTLTIPFTFDGARLTVTNARAFGTALGLTADGQIDTASGQMALNGTIVPVYAINSLLGRVPLLGWLVTGGQKGGGIVAFNFSMSGSTAHPDIDVNPLSALTPGFLRQIFSIFNTGLAPVAKPEKPAPFKPESEDAAPPSAK